MKIFYVDLININLYVNYLSNPDDPSCSKYLIHQLNGDDQTKSQSMSSLFIESKIELHRPGNMSICNARPELDGRALDLKVGTN